MSAYLSLASGAMATAADLPRTPSLIPWPAELLQGHGRFVVNDGAVVAVPPGDADAMTAATRLIDLTRVNRGLTLKLIQGTVGDIVFVRTSSGNAESYDLTIGQADGIRIAASDRAGLFYGAMTLAQLLSPDARFGRAVEVPVLTIHDQPRFAWRGLMLDPARHFLPAPEVKTIIDTMAQHKLNVLHLHLTDDQGWRIEIKRYPKLTEIGAWRIPANPGGPAGQPYGGFYTQDEIRDLVAYAAERSVTIVPEIDLPGHAQAAVAAYPEVGVFGDRPAVSADWGVNPYLFDVDDVSLRFVFDVLDEVMDLFPSTFIHIGGDEAIKDQWTLSPLVQARMKALGLKDEHELQSWFISELGAHLNAHGRRLIGWDEILEGGLPASASVMSWRGEQGAIDAANAGHDVVLSPAPTLYLDSLQSRRADEPPGRIYIVSLADLYAYDPQPKGISDDRLHHVLGAQANAWSEFLVTPYQVQHVVFPRLDALAEITWSPKEGRDFQGFLTRLDPQRDRYRRQGVHAADSAFAVDFTLQESRGAALRAGRAEVVLSTQTDYGRIRYTTNGSVPTARSTLYSRTLSLPLGSTVKAAAFTVDGRMTATARVFDTGREALLTRTSSELTACPAEAQGLRAPLTPEATGTAPAINMTVFNACQVYPAAPLDQASDFTVRVVRLARHYGLAQDFKKVVAHYNATQFGELVVRVGGCEGAVAATFPLPDPETAGNRLTFGGRLPPGDGDQDLCLLFTAPLSGPTYAVETMTLMSAP